MKALLMIAALTLPNAHAGEIVIHGVSWHNKDFKCQNGHIHKHNESNKGTGFSTGRFAAGYYKNSIGYESVYVNYNYYFGSIKWFYVKAGFVTGYTETPMVMLLPVLRFKITKDVSIETVLIPPGDKAMIFAIGNSLTVRI